MSFSFNHFVFFLLFFFSIFISYGQQIEDLKSEIDNEELEIRKINEQLSDNRKEQLKSNDKLKLLEKRLNIRQNLLKRTNQQILYLESQLKKYDSKVLSMESKIDSLRSSLISAIYYEEKLLYSNSQVLEYSKYETNLLTNLYRSNIDTIDSLILLAGIARKELSLNKLKLKSLQLSRKEEVERIISETAEIDLIKKELKSSESLMLSTIKDKRAKINQLQREIQRLVELENKSNSNTLNLADGEKLYKSKGLLPSPITKPGHIIDSYGIHSHPSIKNVKISNNGINIAFSGYSDVLSVSDGEVRGVYCIAGLANTILIRHGEYISVYSNLSSVSVKKGQFVTRSQKIGSIFSNDTSENFLHFELWHESKNLDPSLWLNFK